MADLQTALGQAQAAIQAGVNVGQSRNQRKWSSQEAEKAYQRQIEMWNRSVAQEQAMFDRNNKYNSPAAQRQRLIDAGLNPAVIMQQGVTHSGGSSMSPSAPSAPQASPVQAPRLELLESQLMATEIAKRHADIKKTEAETEAVKASTVGQQNINSIFDLTKTMQENSIILQQGSIQSQKLDNTLKSLNNELASETMQANIGLAEQKFRTALEEANQKQFQNSLNPMQAQALAQQLNLTSVNIGIAKAEKRLKELGYSVTTEQLNLLIQDGEVKNQTIQSLTRANKIGEQYDLPNASINLKKSQYGKIGEYTGMFFPTVGEGMNNAINVANDIVNTIVKKSKNPYTRSTIQLQKP